MTPPDVTVGDLYHKIGVQAVQLDAAHIQIAQLREREAALVDRLRTALPEPELRELGIDPPAAADPSPPEPPGGA